MSLKWFPFHDTWTIQRIPLICCMNTFLQFIKWQVLWPQLNYASSVLLDLFFSEAIVLSHLVGIKVSLVLAQINHTLFPRVLRTLVYVKTSTDRITTLHSNNDPKSYAYATDKNERKGKTVNKNKQQKMIDIEHKMIRMVSHRKITNIKYG